MKAQVYLIRHGETLWNQEGRYQGFQDTDLSEKGHAQAQALGQALSDVELTSMICSPMKRARDTALAIKGPQGRKFDLAEIDAFKEISHGTWEGRLASELKQENPEFLTVWGRDPEKITWPEGESLQNVSDRVIPAWQSLVDNLQDGDRVALVCHDAILKIIFCHLRDFPLNDIWAFPQGPTACNLVDVVDPDKTINILSMNNLDHLTGELKPAVHKAL